MKTTRNGSQISFGFLVSGFRFPWRLSDTVGNLKHESSNVCTKFVQNPFLAWSNLSESYSWVKDHILGSCIHHVGPAYVCSCKAGAHGINTPIEGASLFKTRKLRNMMDCIWVCVNVLECASMCLSYFDYILGNRLQTVGVCKQLSKSTFLFKSFYKNTFWPDPGSGVLGQAPNINVSTQILLENARWPDPEWAGKTSPTHSSVIFPNFQFMVSSFHKDYQKSSQTVFRISGFQFLVSMKTT